MYKKVRARTWNVMDRQKDRLTDWLKEGGTDWQTDGQSTFPESPPHFAAGD